MHIKNIRRFLPFILTLVLLSCSKIEDNPVSIKIDTGSTGIFEITSSDIAYTNSSMPEGIMDWATANSQCNEMGDGWRLPSIAEWQILINFKDEIPGLTDAYWSSTKVGV